MKGLLPIVRRELLERIRSKAFVIGTVLGPVLLAGFSVVPALLATRAMRPLKVAVLDATGTLRPEVEESLRLVGHEDRPGLDLHQRQARFEVVSLGQGSADELKPQARKAVLDGRIDGFVLLPPDALTKGTAEYHGRNPGDVDAVRRIDRALAEAFLVARLGHEGVEPSRVRELLPHVALRTLRVSETGEREDKGGAFLLALVLMMLLYTGVAMWGQAVSTAVIEEKANRVVEVVVSSVTPTTLFAGKLLGVGGAGLLQFLAWTTALAGVSAYGGTGIGGVTLPEVTPLMLAGMLLFFLLGFFLNAALCAAVGASVNSVQEAQQLMFGALAPLILSVMLFPLVLRNPDSTLSTVLSLVPLFTPILMFLRIALVTPPAWQIALSVVLTLVTIAAVNVMAARIYRVGILMYGKRPTFPEILRWVRHS